MSTEGSRLAAIDIAARHAKAGTTVPTPRPHRWAAGSRWYHLVVAAGYLGLFVWTIRLTIHVQGLWVTILFWMFMGPPAVIEQLDRAHGRPRPSRPREWT